MPEITYGFIIFSNLFKGYNLKKGNQLGINYSEMIFPKIYRNKVLFETKFSIAKDFIFGAGFTCGVGIGNGPKNRLFPYSWSIIPNKFENIFEKKDTVWECTDILRLTHDFFTAVNKSCVGPGACRRPV